MILHPLVNSSWEEQISDIKNHEFSSVDEVEYHCYWDHNIGPNQIVSLLSCYNTNIRNTKNKIILWTLDKINPNFEFLKRFCEIRYFDHFSERKETPLDDYILSETLIARPSFYSDYVRYILLSRYGGIYFDLDIFFFKNFSYLISEYKNFVYSWGRSEQPNGAIYCTTDKDFLNEYINKLISYGGSHLGFQDSFGERGDNQKMLGFQSDIELNVLPCGWFDAEWIYESDFNKWFRNNNGQYFYEDTYCYHWHNRNHLQIEVGSPFHRNIEKLKKDLGF
jgi:hypothetical protein